eukprot:gb/GEZN01005123.1/.p1 GENE.gb/GEZN01005123.1/~~gb/GEZN01005123.1/.p1  ORF type:complete len:569 (-),score=79.99 gb/GEZN01005123.1/:141-1625(-)
MTYGIGANDVANSMGIPVGAGALTLCCSIAFASSAEMTGALVLGDQVSDTLRGSLLVTSQWETYPHLLAIGFLSALFGTTLWLVLASWLKMPVSTTHSIVGAVVGVALLQQGVDGVQWGVLSKIVLSWLVSPVMGGLVAGWTYWAVCKLIVCSANPRRAAQDRLWSIYSLTSGILWVFIAAKVSIPGVTKTIEFAGAAVFGAVIGILYQCCYLRYLNYCMTETPPFQPDEVYLAGPSLKSGYSYDRPMQKALLPNSGSSAAGALSDDEMVYTTVSVDGMKTPSTVASDEKESTASLAESDRLVKRVRFTPQQDGLLEQDPEMRIITWSFSTLLLFTSWLVAFAHGANDVSNAIGPFAAINSILATNNVDGSDPIPFWVLGLGAAGLCLGLATLGYKVMETIGSTITTVTVINGFCIQFGTAVTILLASFLGLPVSTTHTIIGAVMGVGIVRAGCRSLDTCVLKMICLTWVITIPAAALPTVVFFAAARKATGPY